jgi:rod shape-determining protein MreC
MGHATKARLVAALLVLVSLGLITIYFRESSEGELHTAQRIGVSILAPFEAAGERVARPFRDAWAWTADVLDAKEENEKLRKENEALRDQAIRNETAAQENQRLRDLLGYLAGPSFPDDYRRVVSRVTVRPPSPYQQFVLINAGKDAGVRKGYPVVASSGLVGLVTEVTSNIAKVTLLTDQASSVSATVLESSATGIVEQGASAGSLILNRVGKDELVEEGNLVVTAGWRTSSIESIYPRGIPIGTVESVGQQDVDLYKRIQVAPLVDFDSLAEVIVLVPIQRKEEPAARKPAKKTKKP